MLGRAERAGSSWADEIRRASQLDGASREDAVPRMLAKRSTARRVTRSKVPGGRGSARAFCILTSVNVRARATSRRKVAFLWRESMKVQGVWGSPGVLGVPGE